jgi:hypothetical protein
MHDIQLSEGEHSLALEILEQYLRDLKEEIYKTENTDYKAWLRARQDTLLLLLQKLGAVDAPLPGQL